MAQKRFIAKNGLDNNAQTITNIADPVNAQDAATRAYVLANAGGGGGATTAYTRTSFTATAGQTSFTVTYTVGYAEVYLNGVLLNSTDYTASSGTAIVLTLAAVLGDIVEVIAYNVATVSVTDASSLATGTVAAARLGSGTANSTTFLKGDNTWVTPTLIDIPGAWVKKAVDCATTVALTLNTAQVTIDGITLSATSRVLVKNQATASENGIYTAVTTTTWVRDADAATAGNITGATISVDAGTTQFGQLWTNNFKPTDTLGTTAMNWYRVLDSSQPIVLPAGGTTTGTAPLKITPSASVLVTPEAGALEVSSTDSVAYFTGNTTNGRGLIPTCQYFRLAADLSVTATTISPFFGTNSSIPLVANGIYEIEMECYFLKNTAGTLTWTITNSAVVTNMQVTILHTPVGGYTAVPMASAFTMGALTGQTTAAVAFTATSSITNATNHFVRVKIMLENASSTSLRLNVTNGAGTITPRRGSYWKATRIVNTGIYAT